MERLPIPVPTDTQRNSIGKLAQQITEKAQQRYEVRRKTTHRIHSDLGTPNKKPNQRLTEWWNLSFKEFRDELGKSFKLDISVKDRDDWEALLRDRSTEIKRLTEEMVSLETDLNAAVNTSMANGSLILPQTLLQLSHKPNHPLDPRHLLFSPLLLLLLFLSSYPLRLLTT